MNRNELHDNAERALRFIGEAALAAAQLEVQRGTSEPLTLIREALGKAYEPLYILECETLGGDDASE